MDSRKMDIQLRSIDYDIFPFRSPRVPLIRISLEKGTITQAKNKTEKKKLLLTSLDNDIVLAAWPGEWSQDVFHVDNVMRAYNIIAGT